MGGYSWNIFYALINTVILLVIAYLLFGKTAVRIYVDHRKQVGDDMQAAKQAEEHAKTAAAEMNFMVENAAADAKQIIADAGASAKQKSAETQAASGAQADHYAVNKADAAADAYERKLQAELTAESADMLADKTAALLESDAYHDRVQAMNGKFLAYFRENFGFSGSDRLAISETGIVEVLVESATELTAEETEEIRGIILAKTPEAELQVTEKTDAALVGGIRVTVRDTVYDGTLATRLKQVKAAVNADTVSGTVSVSEKITEKVSKVTAHNEIYQHGCVISLSDGICHVSGISDAMAGEMIEFEGGVTGMVLDLNQEDAGVVMLGEYDNVHAGDEVRRTGRIIEVPVGEALIGRVVDALGNPIDGKGKIEAAGTRAIESPAPGVVDRQPVKVPMQTGIKAIDALVPIGRGQRELIIGDRQTGKTAIIMDTILNQRGKDMICIYVAIGQKESTVAGFVEKLQARGAMDYTIVVSATASSPAPMLYIAPYAGAAMGEYFMYNGKDVLIIYDDLSKHAVAYREISLLLHRPPGREAYPGDVFYLHSRLLERAARLSEEKGGGSMTALPIVETQAGDFSAYIPTNVISITDGQIYLESELFNAGVRPAVNAGLSVSRVGGSAQLKAMKQVAGQLRMELAQYRELAAFSQFGSDLDKATRSTLHRGERMMEILKQAQYAPMSAPDQIVSIYAVSKGFADDLELKDIAAFEEGLIPYVNAAWPEYAGLVMSGKSLSRDSLAKLDSIIEAYKKR